MDKCLRFYLDFLNISTTIIITMKSRAGALTLLLVLFILLSPKTILAAPVCSLCILEIQTEGANGDEGEDFVIVQNITSSNLTTNLQLQYLNSQGVLDKTLSLGTMNAGQIKIFVSDALKTVNSSASSLNMALASSGGTLRIVKVASSTTPNNIITTYDKLGWGATSIQETSPASVPPSGATLSRRVDNNLVQDTDDNANDFETLGLNCQDVAFSELQPFVTNDIGQTINAWIELTGVVPDTTDCLLLTASGDSYNIPAASLPALDEIKIVDTGLDNQNQLIPLRLGDTSGQVWFAGTSSWGGTNAVKLPVNTLKYSNLINGQSWALVEGVWQRTYRLTPAETNIYQPNATVVNDDPSACDNVRITELLANPVGDDTGTEWLEIYNDSDNPSALDQCVINIADSNYNFLADDTLAAGEWRKLDSLYSSDGDIKTISLRNSGDTQVSLLRSKVDGTDTIQSFIYSDAPEAESWARFDSGWSWTYALTPSLPNILETTPASPDVTEFPAGSSTDTGGGSSTEPIHTGAPLSITELLPNPASPQTDEDDEFVELYNPGGEAIALDGYKIQTGSKYSYSYTLDHQSIPAGGYLVITSGSSGLSLANSAGQARVLDPAGNVLSETDPYEDAPEGETWAFTNDKWQWTSTPTPNAPNIVTTAAAGLSSRTSSRKTAATKKATTAQPKIKTASTTKAKSSATTTAAGGGDNGSQITPLHPAVLAGVGAAALIYGLYEYRHDLGNVIYRIKRYRATRRASRQ